MGRRNKALDSLTETQISTALVTLGFQATVGKIGCSPSTLRSRMRSMGLSSEDGFNLGLELAEQHAGYGHAMPCGVLGEFCGVDKSTISLIERRAMVKLRNLLLDRHKALYEEVKCLLKSRKAPC